MTVSYISCACNRVPHSADWGNNGLICYGACNAIAIYDPGTEKIGRVLETLHRHKDRINTVRWIKPKNVAPETELLSGSVDGTAIVWSRIDNRFQPTCTLNVNDIVTIVSSVYISDESIESLHLSKLLICTVAINGEAKLWLRDENKETNCFQTLTFGTKLPIECRLLYLPNSTLPLLAVTTEDASIQLFCQTNVEEQLFIKVQVLLGHEDWVRCMDFTYDKLGNVLLATGSQDSTIRLWRISVDKQEISADELQQKKQFFEVNGIKYNVALESVLNGHEGWIYGVHWRPMRQKDSDRVETKLLSCSLDKSMIIWEPDTATGIWTETVRVGEVGGNSAGFYGCKFSPCGLNILAHGYQGSFHIWRYSNELNIWEPRYAPSGHFSEVNDLCWDPKGRFLVTVSKDQTTRIHGPLKNNSKEMWHEIGRPQVHGYDMACVAMLNSYMFASGAEEKVVRIFTAPEIFKNSLARIANIEDFDRVIAKGAAVPALGLTNKAFFSNNTNGEDNVCTVRRDYIPATEEELMQNTLWPELQKLYGHGYEIFAMAARHDGLLLATACKSTLPEHAAIILWDTKTWTIRQKLMAHQLTVTQMGFSPNNEFLVSVSRDRRWSLFKYESGNYTLLVISPKKDSLHSRIIWCCAWTHDSQYFATGSRDGKIGVWNTSIADDTKNVQLMTSLDTKGCSVTALSFATVSIDNSYVLAIGYDTGHIEIQKLTKSFENWSWTKYVTYDTSRAHHLTVKRLMFRPAEENCDILQLSSCGSDHTIKIYSIKISELSKL